MSKYIVTITPPTPNGDLHIGHIAGPFLSADVFTRIQRQRGHECVLLSYSDDYQSYMQRKGIETGIEPTVLAKGNTEKIKQSLAAMKIAVDNWMSPYGNAFFKDAVRELFTSAQEGGAIEFHDSAEPYCASCNVWGYEAFGRGLCNYCGVDSDASQCEGCANAPDAAEMQEFHCKLCRQSPQFLPVNRAFLHLERFAPLLRDVHGKYKKRRPMESWLDTAINQLKPWGITRPEEAGLDLEKDGSCRVHTWFMGMAGYIAAFREYAAQRNEADLFSRFWRSGEGEVVNFLGFDCVFSHAIAYPVLLDRCPDIYRQRFIPNQFLMLDGLNLSTSRNHAIWARELVEKVGSDSARLYLASIAPEEEEGDFRRDEFESWHQALFEDLVPRIFHEMEAKNMNWGWSRALTEPDASHRSGLQRNLPSGGERRVVMVLNAAQRVSSQVIARLDRVWQEAVQQGLPAGGEILISQHGNLLYHAATGWMDREQSRPMTKGVSFRLASLTKLVTSVVTMKLIEKGTLSLNSSVSSVLPFFKPALANGSTPPILIRHLLTHTSGLSYGFEEPAGNAYEHAGVSDGLDLPAHNFEENLHRLGAMPLRFEPGSQWQYSLATDVLGWVISQIEGDTLASIVKREVTDPLEMYNATFHISDASLLAVPYLQSGRRMADNEMLAVGIGCAQLFPERATMPDV